MFQLQKYFLPLFLFLGLSSIYIHNVSRSVYGGDVGDLVSAASLGGVAHPPGYPLFSMIGFFLTRLTFISSSQAFLVGLISAMSAALGAVVLYFLSYLLTKNKLVSLLGSLTLAFSFLYWFYAEIAEVFALNALFALLLFLLAFSYRYTKKTHYLAAFCFVLALSFGNHQTIILLLPSYLFLIIRPAILEIKKQKTTIWFLLSAFLTGLLPFLYIPIASSMHPLINWDNVHNLQSFFRLVLRQDYGTFRAGIFESSSLLQKLLVVQVYLGNVITQLTIPVVFCSLIGFVALFKKDKVAALSLLLGFLISGPLFIGYAGFPLIGSFYMGVYERFFLLSSLLLLIPFPLGVLVIASFLSKFLKRKILLPLFISIFFVIPVMLFLYNFSKTNLSDVAVGDNLAYDMLSVLPQDSVLVFSGDTIVFNTWYVHYVKNFRPDILIYNIGGGLEGGSFNTQMVAAQKKYSKEDKIDALLRVLKELRKNHRVFSTMPLQPTKGDKITWIPFGLSYAYIDSDIDMPSHDLYLKKISSIWSALHPPTREDLSKKVFHNLTISEFPNIYSNAALAAGTYLYSQYHDEKNSLQFYQKALEYDPTNAKAYMTLGVYYTSQDGKCKDVIANLSTAISLDQFQRLPYFLLYDAYIKCISQKSFADSVVKQFSNTFHQDFFQELKKEKNQ